MLTNDQIIKLCHECMADHGLTQAGARLNYYGTILGERIVVRFFRSGISRIEYTVGDRTRLTEISSYEIKDQIKRRITAYIKIASKK